MMSGRLFDSWTSKGALANKLCCMIKKVIGIENKDWRIKFGNLQKIVNYQNLPNSHAVTYSVYTATHHGHPY